VLVEEVHPEADEILQAFLRAPGASHTSRFHRLSE
jgi:hypothetical protein